MPRPEIHPFNDDEIRSVLLRPHRIVGFVLAQRDRLSASLVGGRHLGLLIVLMLGTGVLAALPFGAALNLDGFWKAALLFTGSAAICFPSLHVFSAFMGSRVKVEQHLALSLVITSVAGLFAFGFFPILWFLRATMSSESQFITPQHISSVLLAVCLAAGIIHLIRCVNAEQNLRSSRGFRWFMGSWLGLLVFIHYRMGLFLGLVE